MEINYILTYTGKKEDFDKQHLDELRALNCTPYRYINLDDVTIVLAKCPENAAGSLEMRLSSPELVVEREQKVYAFNADHK